MKIIPNITLYRCDFCKKEQKRKHAMIQHEEKCSANPVNHRPCLHCPFLNTLEIEIDTLVTDFNGEPVFRKSTAFHCKHFDKLLLHPKTKYLQHRDTLNFVYRLDKPTGQQGTEQFEMPLTCEIQSKTYDEIEEMLNKLT